jgi:hypothetical protein
MAACSNAATAEFPALQGAGPLPQVWLKGLPHLMEAFKQGLMGPGVGAVPPHLASSLLPALSGDLKSWGWAADDGSLWWAPSKLLSKIGPRNCLRLVNGAWAGLQPGTSQKVTIKVLVPCGPQQQGMVSAELDMPGDWHMEAYTTGTLVCEHDNKIGQRMELRSSSLACAVLRLPAGCSLLRMQYDKVRAECAWVSHIAAPPHKRLHCCSGPHCAMETTPTKQCV